MGMVQQMGMEHRKHCHLLPLLFLQMLFQSVQKETNLLSQLRKRLCEFPLLGVVSQTKDRRYNCLLITSKLGSIMLMAISSIIVYVLTVSYTTPEFGLDEKFSFLNLFIYFDCCVCFEQVSLAYEDGRPVDGKGVGRKVIDRVQETYDTELAGKDFAYDGEKSLFTVGPLPRNKLEFTVVLEDVISNRYMHDL